MDKKELYDLAKDAYYNGEEMMTDLEFDELERELGLENEGYIGTHHQKSYTVKHPYLMGSLSKVQIKENENYTVDWEKYENEIKTYLDKSYIGHEGDGWYMEITPKYDGCSWEVVINADGNLVSVSTRGDGEYGKDIKVWFEEEWKNHFEPRIERFFSGNFKEPIKQFIVRGECLIKKSVFEQKYAKDFTLPRSFVAGMLGQDWEGTPEQIEKRNDLSWVCYDYRYVDSNGKVNEFDYAQFNSYIHGVLPGETGLYWIKTYGNLDLDDIYNKQNLYRQQCPYALDGFVIKPCVRFRLQDMNRTRQEDCVAVKFLPEIVDAEIIDVEWNLGKNGEYYPTGILKEVILGGKKVNRVSLSNYGKIIKENIGIGSKIKISLAGDIIPYCYSCKSKGTMMHLPEDTYIDGVHLMKRMTDDDKRYIGFINSVNVIKPDGIGEKVAEKLYYTFGEPDNILDFMIEEDWKSHMDDSKSSQNIIKSLDERKRTLNLQDMIQSLGYETCGEKNALWLAKYVSGLKPDTKGISTTILDLSEDQYFLDQVKYYAEKLGLSYLKEEKTEGKVFVILTGSPKIGGYATKNEFLNKHQELIETTSWNECQMLITDSLESTSSKMEKAKKKGIPIKTYMDF